MKVTAVVDLSDMLRAEIVMAVSALDHYIHEISRLGMIECWLGRRPVTPSFQRFSISISLAQTLFNPATAVVALDTIIREKHGYISFQKPEKIAEAVRLFSSVSLWEEVASILNQRAEDVKATLGLIIDRRNKIVHEADVDPSFPDQRWPVDEMLVEEMIDNIENIGHGIHDSCS